MKWIDKHVNANLTESYNNKYGNSDYWQYQRLMFEHQDILNAFNHFIKIVEVPIEILDIGINNALEIEILKKISQLKDWDWNSINLTGLDLSQNALNIAENRLSELSVHFKLFNEDVVEYDLQSNYYDTCLAITSLQSASIYGKDYESYFQKIINSMKKTSSFLIIVPDCSFENGFFIDGGAYNVNLNRQDKLFAEQFINRSYHILNKNNYEFEILGNTFKSIVATRK